MAAERRLRLVSPAPSKLEASPPAFKPLDREQPARVEELAAIAAALGLRIKREESAADLHILADYLVNLARLAPDPVTSYYRRLARLPLNLAVEVHQLAEGIEGRMRSPNACRRRP